MATPELDKLRAKAKVANSILEYETELTGIKSSISSIKSALESNVALMEADTDYFPAGAVTETEAILTKIDAVIAAWNA